MNMYYNLVISVSYSDRRINIGLAANGRDVIDKTPGTANDFNPFNHTLSRLKVCLDSNRVHDAQRRRHIHSRLRNYEVGVTGRKEGRETDLLPTQIITSNREPHNYLVIS